MRAVNIIIIGYGLGSIEIECLSSVITHTQYPNVITYYDNVHDKYTLTEIWNKLIKASPCDFICLLNNDTKVTSDWLTRMMGTLIAVPECKFIGPSTNNCHSPQKKIPTKEIAEKHTGKAIAMKDPISGFCLLFAKETWESVDGFDSRYKHYGQESDLIDRVQQQGGKCYWRQDAFVYHIGEASVKKSGIDIHAARMEARKLYWSSRPKL